MEIKLSECDLTPLENIILNRYDIMVRVSKALGLEDNPNTDDLSILIMRDCPEKDYINEKTLISAINKLKCNGFLPE